LAGFEVWLLEGDVAGQGQRRDEAVQPFATKKVMIRARTCSITLRVTGAWNSCSMAAPSVVALPADVERHRLFHRRQDPHFAGGIKRKYAAR
jgi:hypothetical protein